MIAACKQTGISGIAFWYLAYYRVHTMEIKLGTEYVTAKNDRGLQIMKSSQDKAPLDSRS